MLSARYYFHFDYDVFEGIHVDFYIIVFFHPYFIALPTATQLASSNKNDDLRKRTENNCLKITFAQFEFFFSI